MIDRIESIASKELARLSHNTIIRDGNIVECFGHYTIEPSGDFWQVTKDNTVITNFDSLRTSVSWCIADKSNAYDVSQQIKFLGMQLVSKIVELRLASKYAKQVRSNLTKHAIVQDKLSETRARIHSSKEQLNKLINVTKYIQIKGFNNEPPRFRKEADSKRSKNV